MTARVLAAVEAEIDAHMRWKGPHAFADGLTGLQHARAHRAAMSAERRAELDRGWE
jgi:hypothetical protein